MNKKLLILSLGFLLFLSLSFGKETRLNISMWEIVDQNVTFAQNFYLVENRVYCRITGYLNVSNPSNDTVYDIRLNITNTNNLVSNFTWIGGRYGNQTQGVHAGEDFVIHIPELRPGNYSLFTYNVSCITVNPPLNIETNYSNYETGLNRKVLAGHNFTVHKKVSHDLTITANITDINITMETQGVKWNETLFNFTFAKLWSVGDYKNVHGNGTNNRTWYWVVNNGTLQPGESANITFDIKAPYNVPTTATYLFLKETLRYRVLYLASNLSIGTIRAKAKLLFEEDKQIIRPQDNELNTNATWLVSAKVSVPINISYNLTKVTLWVTQNLSPISYTGINKTYIVNQEINETTYWQVSDWTFNYTDASDNTSSRPPIVWIRPFYYIMDKYNQIVKSELTTNGSDIYLSYIYVVNGYWLKVSKNITNIGKDKYRIYVLVQNIGNAWTPEGLVVTVYDFVPIEFKAYGWSVLYDSFDNVSSEEFNGTAYRWTIPLKPPYNSSLGPCNGPHAVPFENCSWNLTYYVNGTGIYKVSDLYIVGLDPRKVDGAGTHEGIKIETIFSSQKSREILFASIVGFLLVLNITNLMLTKSINDKIRGKI